MNMMFLEQDSGKEQCTLVYLLHLFACTTSTYPRLNMFNNINTCICTGNIVHKGTDNSPHTLVSLPIDQHQVTKPDVEDF